MTSSRFTTVLALIVVVLLVNSSRLRADSPPSLSDLHDLLLQAAGDSADSMPPDDQQKELIGQAIKMIRRIPHGHRSVLVRAKYDLVDAINELGSGDAAYKVRGDILDADDLVKSIMDR